MHRIVSIFLIGGTIIAWVGESRPIISDFYSGVGDPQQIVSANPSAWTVAHVLMILGAIVAALGLILLAREMGPANADGSIQRIAKTTVGLIVGSVLLYALNRYSTIVNPADAFAVRPDDMAWLLLNGLPSLGFGILWQLALVVIGLGLVKSGFPKWLGWLVIIVSGVSLVANLITFGLPPGLNFFLVLFLGIVLFFVQGQQQAGETQLETAVTS